jgi:MFS family permease
MAWLGAAIFYLYEYFVRVTPSVMEEDLRRAFGVSASTLGLASGLYYMVYGPLQIVVGPLYDRFGPRRLFTIAAVLLFFGCFLAALPQFGIAAFAVGRLIMGVGSAFAFIGTMYVASVWFPPSKWAYLSGLTTALGMLGAILGQGPVAAIIHRVGWKKTWLLEGILGIGIAFLILRAIPRSPSWELRRRRAHFDTGRHFFGQFLACLFAVARNPQTWLSGTVACALFMPLIVFADFWGIRYIELLTGVATAKASAINGMLYLGWLLGSPLFGGLSDRLRQRRIFLIGSCSCCLLATLTLLSFSHLSTWTTAALLFVLGVVSSPQVICFTVSMESNPHYASGAAIALVNTIVMLVGGIMQSAFGLILDFQFRFNLPDEGGYSIGNFRGALIILPIALFVGGLLSLLIEEPRKSC